MKKMATKIDESLFDQAPEEAAPTPAPVVRPLLVSTMLQRRLCLVNYDDFRLLMNSLATATMYSAAVLA